MHAEELNWVGLIASIALSGVTAGGLTQVAKKFLRVAWDLPVISADHSDPKWLRMIIILLPIIFGAGCGVAIEGTMDIKFAVVSGIIGGTLATTLYKRAISIAEKLNAPT